MNRAKTTRKQKASMTGISVHIVQVNKSKQWKETKSPRISFKKPEYNLQICAMQIQ